MTDNRLYWIWLQQALEPGGVKTALALSAFASPEAIHRASRAELMRAGFTGALLARLCRKSLDPAARILEDSLKDGAFVLTMGDDAYPDCLRNTYMPPLVLYGKGELPPLDRLPAVAMVGTRKASDYGCRAASSIAAGLAAGGCIVISGGAVGIDGASHRGALAGGGLTIAVQGCGLDVDYPKPNRRLREEILAADGVIVTEYPPAPRLCGSTSRSATACSPAWRWRCASSRPRNAAALSSPPASPVIRDGTSMSYRGKSPPETAAVPTT